MDASDSPVLDSRKSKRSEKRREFILLLKQPELFLAILFVFAVLILFCIYPIVRLFISCITDKNGQIDFSNILYVFEKTDFFQAFWKSAVVFMVSSMSRLLEEEAPSVPRQMFAPAAFRSS